VSFFPCSHCGQRAVGKLAAIYANWFEEDESRAAFRTRYCVACLTDLMAGLKNGLSTDSGLLTVCPSCGTDSSQSLSGVYLTIYPPKQPEREYALTTCTSCAALLHERFRSEGDKLGDRTVGAAAPTNAPSAAWSEIPW
jgi:RNase P subunit RPR2